MSEKIVSSDGWWALEPVSGGSFHIMRKALRDEDDDWMVTAGIHVDELVQVLGERGYIPADTMNTVANVKEGLACQWCGFLRGEHHEHCGKGDNDAEN